ncbi:hypothetical protein [Lysinibacillus sp. BPa_S21]|uniref:hypothetical protein n=1 Tax=Lysinibacillus sp. BPa_S21 TaxID=2932478 RepID=UPI002012A701|nr:hypothetical protein [Lysinibacillus sp. BPa_S21]MCL1696251.1 hypothetical protein [Lysinibacillus sp. BPa_S21]
MKKILVAGALSLGLLFIGLVDANAKYPEMKPTPYLTYDKQEDYADILKGKGYTKDNWVMVMEKDPWIMLKGYSGVREVKGFTNGEKIFRKRHMWKDNEHPIKFEDGKRYLFVYDVDDRTDKGILEIIEIPEK